MGADPRAYDPVMDERLGAAERSEGRLALRFVVGAVSLGRERLVEELRRWEQVARAEGPAPPRPPTRRAGQHRALGAVLRLPTYAARVRGRVRHHEQRVRARVRPAWLRVSRTRRGRRWRAQVDAWTDRVRRELELWERLGGAEEAEARALARVGLSAAPDALFERLADDPKLRALIAEQSTGMTRSALEQLRDRAAGADARVESFFERLLRRPLTPAAEE